MGEATVCVGWYVTVVWRPRSTVRAQPRKNRDSLPFHVLTLKRLGALMAVKDSWLSSQKVMPVLWLETETKLWLGPGGKDLVQALVKGDSLNLCPTDSVLKEKQIPASVVMGWNSEQEDEEETLLLLSCSNCSLCSAESA